MGFWRIKGLVKVCWPRSALRPRKILLWLEPKCILRKKWARRAGGKVGRCTAPSARVTLFLKLLLSPSSGATFCCGNHTFAYKTNVKTTFWNIFPQLGFALRGYYFFCAKGLGAINQPGPIPERPVPRRHPQASPSCSPIRLCLNSILGSA